MKNSELMRTKRKLPPVEKQRRYILLCLVQKNECPNCGSLLNFFEGAGIDIDDWHTRIEVTACSCTECKRELKYVVPLLALGGNGGWRWQLIPIALEK